MLSVLAIDIETHDWKNPQDNSYSRVIQVAWISYDEEEKEIGTECYYIKPDGFEISAKATALHGITNEKAKEEGKSLKFVLDKLSTSLKTVKTNDGVVIAHNIKFDVNGISQEMKRLKMTKELRVLAEVKKGDTLDPTHLRKYTLKFHHKKLNLVPYRFYLHRKFGLKLAEMLKLVCPEEEHEQLLKKAHTADADAKMCAIIYFQLCKSGIIEK